MSLKKQALSGVFRIVVDSFCSKGLTSIATNRSISLLRVIKYIIK